jgi:GH24 family phage-related lysozyme (muramidase)
MVQAALLLDGVKAVALFCQGVLLAMVQMLGQMGRQLWRVERSSEHVVKRVVAVESRVKGTRKRVFFLYRWLRYVLHRYRAVPNWLKAAKIMLLILAVFGPSAWDAIQRQHRQNEIYESLYQHHYDYYRAQNQSETISRYYADLYARKYAEYYTSSAYQEALRYALPEEQQIASEQPPAETTPPSTTPPPKAQGMVLLPEGIKLVKSFEGLMLKPYKDAGGKYTIGYGHLMRPSDRFTRISEARAEALLRKDLRIAESVVQRHVTVPLTAYQYSALVSLVYNIGAYQFRTSTLLKKLNQGDYRGAGRQFLRWNKVGRKTLRGLKRRRQAEYKLFRGELTPEV